MGTDPAGGTQARQGSTVNLLVSDGLVEVPDVGGAAIGDANRTMTALGLIVTASPSDSCTGGAVIGQSLSPGAQPQRSPITLTYCGGPVSPGPP